MEMDSDRPSPAKVASVENAISQAAFNTEALIGSGALKSAPLEKRLQSAQYANVG
jgi:hypothetical protein